MGIFLGFEITTEAFLLLIFHLSLYYNSMSHQHLSNLSQKILNLSSSFLSLYLCQIDPGPPLTSLMQSSCNALAASSLFLSSSPFSKLAAGIFRSCHWSSYNLPWLFIAGQWSLNFKQCTDAFLAGRHLTSLPQFLPLPHKPGLSALCLVWQLNNLSRCKDGNRL